MNIEKLLKEKMEQGWNISIECKGKGRTYELSYEGFAYKVNSNFKEQMIEKNSTHSVGTTIEDLLNNMFQKIN